jgi:hypothetical protein
LRNHQAIIQPRLYDCLMVTQITLNTEPRQLSNSVVRVRNDFAAAFSHRRVIHLMMMMMMTRCQALAGHSNDASGPCEGDLLFLTKRVTEVDNDVRGVENTNASCATAAASSASDDSSRQRNPRKKCRRLGDCPFVQHEFGSRTGLWSVRLH